MGKPRAKKCKVCATKFQPFSTTGVVCSLNCALEWAGIQEEKKRAKEAREFKDTLKSMSHWLKITQQVFNEYIRLRDHLEPCISCGTLDAPEWCAGHFRTRGAASQLRFDEDNVHKQCNQHCNMQLSGNIVNYRPRLIAKIGIERVEALENNNGTAKYTREGLAEMRKNYKALIKELKKEAA